MKKIQFFVVILSATFLLFACQKRLNPRCRIITVISDPSGDTSHIFYNAEGKVSRITGRFGTSTYTYSGNTVDIIKVDTGRFTSETTVLLNAAGQATNVLTEFNIAGINWRNTAYEYQGTALVKKIVTTSADPTPNITTYTWLNGNIVYSTSDAASINWGYYSLYTYKSVQKGDYLSYLELLNGYSLYRTREPLRSNDIVSLITYDFNNNVDVSSVSYSVGNTRFTQKYEYECP